MAKAKAELARVDRDDALLLNWIRTLMNTPTSSSIDRQASPEEPREVNEQPTRVRYGVLAFLAAMTFVHYLDRVCIGQSATSIKRDLQESRMPG